MKDIMVDLETLGIQPGCAILSIGACTFNLQPETEADANIGDTFYINVSKSSCLLYNLFIDPKTEAWWASQSDEAKRALEVPEPTDLQQALYIFTEWLKSQQSAAGAENLRIWSHGAAFDLPILQVAARQAGVVLPWSYRNERDTRTLFMLARQIDQENFDQRITTFSSGLSHQALDDAVTQAKQVQMSWASVI